MGEKRDAYMVLVTIPEGKRPHESLEVDGRIILKWIFKMWDWAYSGFIWLKIGTGKGRL